MKFDAVLYVAKNKGFLYSHEDIVCDVCRAATDRGGYYLEAYSRFRPPLRTVLCGRCYRDDKLHPKGYELVNDCILVSGYVPDGASVWSPAPPNLVGVRGVGMDVFEAADKLQDCEVEDGTVLAGRPEACLGGVDGVLIGKRPEDVRDPDSDDAIIMLEGSVDRIRDYLRDLLPVDETVVKKLLEDESS